jgi:hypothetical protein
MASMQLRQLIDNILEDTSRDEREQCDAVDVAFQKRVTEMEDAKTKMEENLKKVKFESKVVIYLCISKLKRYSVNCCIFLLLFAINLNLEFHFEYHHEFLQ